MNTTAKHLAFNLIVAAALLIVADIAWTHALVALGLFAAAGLLAVVMRDYATPRRLVLPCGKATTTPRVLGTHRLAA